MSNWPSSYLNLNPNANGNVDGSIGLDNYIYFDSKIGDNVNLGSPDSIKKSLKLAFLDTDNLKLVLGNGAFEFLPELFNRRLYGYLGLGKFSTTLFGPFMWVAKSFVNKNLHVMGTQQNSAILTFGNGGQISWENCLFTQISHYPTSSMTHKFESCVIMNNIPEAYGFQGAARYYSCTIIGGYQGTLNPPQFNPLQYESCHLKDVTFESDIHIANNCVFENCNFNGCSIISGTGNHFDVIDGMNYDASGIPIYIDSSSNIFDLSSGGTLIGGLKDGFSEQLNIVLSPGEALVQVVNKSIGQPSLHPLMDIINIDDDRLSFSSSPGLNSPEPNTFKSLSMAFQYGIIPLSDDQNDTNGQNRGNVQAGQFQDATASKVSVVQDLSLELIFSKRKHFGNGLIFNGSGSRVNIPLLEASNLAFPLSWTFCCWLKISDINIDPQAIFSNADNTNVDSDIRIQLRDIDTIGQPLPNSQVLLEMICEDSSNNSSSTSAVVSYQQNQIVFCCFCADGVNSEVYFNGQLVANGNNWIHPSSNWGNRVNYGCFNNDFLFFENQLGEAMFWIRKLSKQEIGVLYNKGNPIELSFANLIFDLGTTELLFHHRFDESGTATITTDDSQNNYDGVLTNFSGTYFNTFE